MGRARLGEYLLGVQGMALIRSWLASDPVASARRIEEIKSLLASLDRGLASVELDAPELDVGPGYAAWSATYDELPNPLIQLEEPVVRSLVDGVPVGRALDAGCGTGRYTQYLLSRGHSVIGVDAVPEMLERARRRAPRAEIRLGDLADLPLGDATVDLAVCALALTHFAELGLPLAELARVVRPGGRVILSDLHPGNLLLGGGALFQASDGRYGIVRSYHHPHADYVSAFVSAGLDIVRCVEPAWTENEVEIMAGPLFSLAPEAFRSAMIGIPGALVWELRRA